MPTKNPSAELLRAIERAEQIANLLESAPLLAWQEIAAIEYRGPLLAEYNRISPPDLQGCYARTLGGLLGLLGKAHYDHQNPRSYAESIRQNPRSYAEPIRGYCKILRRHLDAKAGESTEDDLVWVLASKLYPERFKSYRKFVAFLDEHPEIRRRKPSPQRLKVHVGDWVNYWLTVDNATFDAIDRPVPVDEETENAFLDGVTNRLAKVQKKKGGK